MKNSLPTFDFTRLKGEIIFYLDLSVRGCFLLNFANNIRNRLSSFTSRRKQFISTPFKGVRFTVKSINHLAKVA
jgi:hypothetical protein